MKYSEYRSRIKSGDILGFSHEGWGSFRDFKIQMVRIFTRSNYSHVGIAVELSGRLFCLESVMPEARLYPLSKLGSFYHIGMNANWTPEVEEKAFSHIGDKYSQWEAVKAFFVDLGQKTSQCAAFVDTVMGYLGWDMGAKQTPDAIVLQAGLLGHAIQYVENK